jgi:peptidyl-tRNA hydrolase
LKILAQQHRLIWKKEAKLSGSLALAYWSPDTPTRLLPDLGHPEPDKWLVQLYRPRCYMNESGRLVWKASQALLEKRDITFSLLVAHDDLERDVGLVSLKEKGSAK